MFVTNSSTQSVRVIDGEVAVDLPAGWSLRSPGKVEAVTVVAPEGVLVRFCASVYEPVSDLTDQFVREEAWPSLAEAREGQALFKKENRWGDWRPWMGEISIEAVDIHRL